VCLRLCDEPDLLDERACAPVRWQLIDLSDDWEATLLDDNGELKEGVKLRPQYQTIVERHFAHGTVFSSPAISDLKRSIRQHIPRTATDHHHSPARPARSGDDVFVLTVTDLDLGGPEIVFDVLVADG
jgi:hypothetical protein